MKVVRKEKKKNKLTYDEMQLGHLYVDEDDDLVLRTDTGVVDIEAGIHYEASETDRDEGIYPFNNVFTEVGAAVLNIEE